MPIDYPAVLNLREEGRRFSWTERDTMLYALAVGMGRDPLDRDELPFVYERNLKVIPTLAAVVAWGAGIAPERMGLDRRRTLHGEESLSTGPRGRRHQERRGPRRLITQRTEGIHDR